VGLTLRPSPPPFPPSHLPPPPAHGSVHFAHKKGRVRESVRSMFVAFACSCMKEHWGGGRGSGNGQSEEGPRR